MSREIAKQLLLKGKWLHFEVFQFSEHSMNCTSECCYSYYNNVEEALDDIEYYSDGDWDEVWCYE